MTVVGPYPVSVVASAALHNIVGEIGFCDLVVWVYHDLKERTVSELIVLVSKEV